MEQLDWLWKKRWEIAWVGGNKGMIADRLYMYSTCVRVGGGGRYRKLFLRATVLVIKLIAPCQSPDDFTMSNI